MIFNRFMLSELSCKYKYGRDAGRRLIFSHGFDGDKERFRTSC